MKTLFKDKKCRCYSRYDELTYKCDWLFVVCNDDKTETLYKIELDKDVFSKSLHLTDIESKKHIVIENGMDFFYIGSTDEKDWKIFSYWLLAELNKRK